MRSRTIVGLLALALAVPAGLSTSASAGPASGDHAKIPDQWAAVRATWAGVQQPVSVVDVEVFGNYAYVVGNTRRAGKSRAWVQACTATRCTRTALPRPSGRSTSVSSISGTSRVDMWAVGTSRAGSVLRPVFWRKTGATWRVFNSGVTVKDKAESLNMTQIEVANKSKAYALGRYNYLTGKTSTLYRWNGTDWKELGSFADPDQLEAPCNRWFYRDWTDLVVRSGAAMLVGSCDAPKKRQHVILQQGTGKWNVVAGNGLPANARFTKGEFVWQEAYLMGTRAGKRVIFKQTGKQWDPVTVKGLGPKTTVADLAGPFSSKVVAVGYKRTDRTHRVATAWLWSKSGWREAKVPGGVSKSRLVAVAVDGKSRFFAVGVDSARKPGKRGLIIRSNR